MGGRLRRADTSLAEIPQLQWDPSLPQPSGLEWLRPPPLAPYRCARHRPDKCAFSSLCGISIPHAGHGTIIACCFFAHCWTWNAAREDNSGWAVSAQGQTLQCLRVAYPSNVRTHRVRSADRRWMGAACRKSYPGARRRENTRELSVGYFFLEQVQGVIETQCLRFYNPLTGSLRTTPRRPNPSRVPRRRLGVSPTRERNIGKWFVHVG
jgi:hypothetical protein